MSFKGKWLWPQCGFTKHHAFHILGEVDLLGKSKVENWNTMNDHY